MLVVAIVGAWLLYSVLNPSYILNGKFIDTDNGKAVQGVVLKAGDKEVTSGQDGQYTIQGVKKNTKVAVFPQKEYQPINAQIDYGSGTKAGWKTKKIQKDYNLQITEVEKKARLAQDVKEIYDAFKFERWDNVYDLMHADTQKSITKAAYVAMLKDGFKGAAITGYQVENLKFLDTWTFEPTGKQYVNAAQGDISITAQTLGINQTINKSAHFVKDNNHWKWFYSPNNN